MKISSKWLQDYIDHDINTSNIDKIAHELAILGFEPENIEHIKNDFENFVTGRVTSCSKHPDADKLSVCTVDTKEYELQIVCGAPNVKKGQIVPVALPGAKVGDFKIKKAKLRGVESNGMICAGDELGISDDHEGIMVLDENIEPGTPLNKLFGYEDITLELEVTANRADVLGHIGFAREFAFLKNCDLKLPEVRIEECDESADESISVEIKEPSACPRYSARVIKDVEVKESPEWLKNRLIAVGLRPINNVVDITNFVMMETGHPLHAFDLDVIEDKKIIVRKAREKEKFVTLDENEFELNEDILLICDGKKPVALAGVMGGLNSGVSSKTKNVLIEVAHFNLADIRETVKLTNIHSDSSKRFERGVDPNNAEWVINRAAFLIKETSGGRILKGIVDNYPSFVKEKPVDVRLSRIEKVLGFCIEADFVTASFRKIGLETEQKDADTVTVTVPTFRPDITSEIDLIEEAVRLYGYDKIPEKTSSNIDLRIDGDRTEEMIDGIREDLVRFGLYEISGKSMVDKKFCEMFPLEPVNIEHPLNEEMNHLRNSLLINALQAAGHNLRRKNDTVRIFETGRIFFREDENIVEKESVAVLLSGIKNRQFWDDPEKKYDFYDIKGLIEQYVEDIGIKGTKFSDTDIPGHFDPERSLSLYLKKRKIGTLGEIAEDVTLAFDIKQPVYCFEAYADDIAYLKNRVSFGMEELSKYPKVIKDISLLISENEKAENIFKVIKKYGGAELRYIEVVDRYTGEQTGSGKKSYTFRMTFQSNKRTLKDRDIDKMFNKVINGLKKDLEAEIR